MPVRQDKTAVARVRPVKSGPSCSMDMHTALAVEDLGSTLALDRKRPPGYTVCACEMTFHQLKEATQLQATKGNLDTLRKTARQIRRLVLTAVHSSGAGHTGGAMSIPEILSVLYFHTMKIDPDRPLWPERDRFILSKGHASVGLYAALCLRGYFGESCMCEFDQIDGRLQGHPDMLKTPGVDMSTGSLGQGLSAGLGMAMGRDRRGLDSWVYVLMGDGELQEGQVWEAAMYAGFHRIKKLIAIVDYNQLQLTGWTKDTLDLEPLDKKWEAFGWKVFSCDGHDVGCLVETMDKAKAVDDGPVVVIARTMKGRGVSFIEGNVGWHAKAPSDQELKRALEELECGK